MNKSNQVQRAIGACLRRWRFACFVSDLVRVIATALVVACVLVTLARWVRVPANTWMVLGLCGSAAVLVRLAVLWNPQRIRHALLGMDERLGLKDALVTASECARKEPTGWEQLIFDDFLDRIEHVRIHDAWRSLPSTRTLAILALSAVYIGLFSLLPARNVPSPAMLERLRQLSEDSQLLVFVSQPGPRARSLSSRVLELLERLWQSPSAVSAEEFSALISDLHAYPERASQDTPNESGSGSGTMGTGSGSGTARASGEVLQDLEELQRALVVFREQLLREPVARTPEAHIADAQTDSQNAQESNSTKPTTRTSQRASRELISIQAALDAAVDEIPKRTYEIHEEPIPWERIPLWQQPIVRRYFSKDDSSQ